MFRRVTPTYEPECRYPPLASGQVAYVVGDVHGRADLLTELHAAIDADIRPPGTMAIEVYLGDYVDRGPDSRSVVDLLSERAIHRRLVLIRGNHEVLFEDFVAGRLSRRAWRRRGGDPTLLSYGIDPEDAGAGTAEDRREATNRRIPAAHRAFLNALTGSFSLGSYFFVHAGIRPGVPLDRQTPDDLHWIRSEFLHDDRDFGAIVVHGHTPARSPVFRPNRIGIDTGAYATGCLTCLVIDECGPSLLLQTGGRAPGRDAESPPSIEDGEGSPMGSRCRGRSPAPEVKSIWSRRGVPVPHEVSRPGASRGSSTTIEMPASVETSVSARGDGRNGEETTP